MLAKEIFFAGKGITSSILCERTSVSDVSYFISKMNAWAYFLNTAVQDETSHLDSLCISPAENHHLWICIFYSVLRSWLKSVSNEWKTDVVISTSWLSNSVVDRVIQERFLLWEDSPYSFSLVRDNFLRF